MKITFVLGGKPRKHWTDFVVRDIANLTAVPAQRLFSYYYEVKDERSNSTKR